MNKSLFSFKGRAKRAEYWKIQLILPLTGLIAAFFLGGQPIEAEPLSEAELLIVGAAAVFVFFLWFWAMLAVQIKRFHDRNKSGWWILIGFIPYLGQLWVLTELGFLKGVDDENRFN